MTSNLLIGYPDIPFRATTQTANKTAATGSELSLLTAGDRQRTFDLAMATADDLWTNYTLGATSSSQFFALLGAKELQSKGCARVSLRGSAQSAFLPSSITGLKLWLDPTRGVTVDSSTNQVSAWADQSSNGKTASQGTSAKQPILTRGDNKENRVLYSEVLSNSNWTKSNLTITDNAIANPVDGLVTADLAAETTATGGHVIYSNAVRCLKGETIVFSAYLKSYGGRDWVVFYRDGGSAFSGAKYAWVDITNGVIGTSFGSPSMSIESAGSGWFKVTFTETAAASGTGNIRVDGSVSDGGSTSYTGDAAKGFYLWGAQMRKSTADSTYLATTAGPQIAGINGLKTLWFDGSDDWLNTDYYPDIAAGVTIFVVARGLFNGSAGAAIVMCNDDTAQSRILCYWDSARNANFIILKDWSNYLQRYMLAETLDSTFVQSYKFTGGTSATDLSFYKNGTQIDTTSVTAGTYSAPSVGTKTIEIGSNKSGANLFWPGEICEVLIYEASLSTANRQAVEAYLTSKWLTSPVASNVAFSSATLYGPRSEDFITTFSTSSAFLNWWVQLSNDSTHKYKHSKQFFGSWFDFGRDPEKQAIIQRVQSAGNPRDLPYRFPLRWKGITPTVVNSLIDKILKYRDVCPVILYDTADVFLNDHRLLYCQIIDSKITPVSASAYDVELQFQEVI